MLSADSVGVAVVGGGGTVRVIRGGGCEFEVKVGGDGGELEAEVVPGLCTVTAGVSVFPLEENSAGGHAELETGVCDALLAGDAYQGTVVSNVYGIYFILFLSSFYFILFYCIVFY